MYGKLFGVLAALSLGQGIAGAAEHGHAQHGAAASHSQSGVMATDAALRQGMEDIRAIMADGVVKRPGPADYPRLANAVEAGIDRITKTCVLPPEADARLHQVLVRMIDGVEHMRASENQQSGVAKVLGALDEYGRGFDHPGWRPFGH